MELSPKAQAKLVEYSWPGNIRELENVIHHSLLTCGDGLVQAQDLRLSHLRLERQEEEAGNHGVEDLLLQAFSRLYEEQPGDLYEKVENALLRSAYHFCHYNQVHTAQLLGLSRNVTRTRLIAIGELVVNKRRVQEEQVLDARVVRLSI